MKTGTKPQTLQLASNKPAGKREPLGKEISGRETKTPPWRTICAVLTCHIIDSRNFRSRSERYSFGSQMLG
jgi:hypothetical protein